MECSSKHFKVIYHPAFGSCPVCASIEMLEGIAQDADRILNKEKAANV